MLKPDRILGFPLKAESGVQEVRMPSRAEILTVEDRYGEPTIWAAVNEQEPEVLRQFTVAPTGDDITDGPCIENIFETYIGTIHQGLNVYHVFKGCEVAFVHEEDEERSSYQNGYYKKEETRSENPKRALDT